MQRLERTPATQKIVEASMVGLTLLRLAGAEYLARKVSRHENILIPMIVYVATDIADGAIARKLHAETPLRRFVDAVVDRASVARVGFAVAIENPASLPYLAALGVRELIVGSANALHYRATGEVVQGKGVHKLGPLSTALFGVAAASNNEVLTHATGAVAGATNLILSSDYVMNARVPHGKEENGIRQIAFDTQSLPTNSD